MAEGVDPGRPPRQDPARDAGAAGAEAAGATERTGAAVRAGMLVAEVGARNGVRATALIDPAEHRAASAVLQRIWGHPDGAPLPPEMLRAFAYTGNYVGAVLDGNRIVGVSTAFRTDHGVLHSHIAGVLAEYRGRSIGYLLKLHQRAWALEHGIGSIAWTFDPLIRRNAHFNLVKLGAAATDYLCDFYGEMTDQINVGERSDRLLVEWDLLGPVPGRPIAPEPDAVRVLDLDEHGGPVRRPGSDTDRLLQVPLDMEALRRKDPALGGRWRMALRATFTEAFDDGHRIVGMDDNNAYITRKERP